MDSSNINENNITLESNNSKFKLEQSFRKQKEERIYVKSNKGKKIELKNLDQIEQIINLGDLDDWTKNKLLDIKNITFKNNVFDIEKKMIVSSIRLVKNSKLGRKITPMVWEYYKNRGNLDVNQIIKQYSRDNLIINYSICPQRKNVKIYPESFNSESFNPESFNQDNNNVNV